MTLARVVDHRGVEFLIERGEIVLLRGPNGSGKTSLLRALAGLPAPLAPLACEVRARVAYAPQDARDALVGLTVGGEFRLRSMPVPAEGLPPIHRASRELSSGEARRVALAATGDAELLLLDEPVEGLDADGRAWLAATLRRVAGRGAVVLADHAGALDVATRVIQLAPSGRVELPPIPRVEGPLVVEATPARLRGVPLPSVRLGPGFHVVRGANGAGKSTLFLRLAGLLDATGVRIHGAPPTPGGNVRLLLPHAGDLLTGDRVADDCREHPLVPASLRERHPLALSGGEAQRVAIAKTLGVDAPLVLLDEPEAHLDAEGRALLAAAIASCVARGACVLAATHDDALAALAHEEVVL